MKFISYLKTKMRNTTLQTIMAALIIVSGGTFSLALLAQADSKLSDLHQKKAQLLEELSELREEKVLTFSELRAASGAYAIARELDELMQEQIEAKRTELKQVERLIMAETGEDFTQTFE